MVVGLKTTYPSRNISLLFIVKRTQSASFRFLEVRVLSAARLDIGKVGLRIKNLGHWLCASRGAYNAGILLKMRLVLEWRSVIRRLEQTDQPKLIYFTVVQNEKSLSCSVNSLSFSIL
jgi:hypothetical protein